MNTIQRKPPIKARNYKRNAELSTTNSLIGIEEAASPDLFLAPINPSISTFDGFFGEKPTQPSLTYELCNFCAYLFLNTSQYLWGPKSSASLLKTIQELMALREFDTSQGEESIENNNKIALSEKSQILQKAGEELYKELEYRETIHNNMLIGNLLGMASS